MAVPNPAAATRGPRRHRTDRVRRGARMIGRARILVVALLLAGIAGCGPRPPSDEELMQRALTAADAVERERAAVMLAGRARAALEATPADRRAGFLDESPAVARMRTLLDESGTPAVQAAAATGLASLRDIDSLPTLLDLMNSAHAIVRLRSAAAVSSLLDIGVSFDATAPAGAERKKAIEAYRWYYDQQLGPQARHREAFRGFLGPERRPIEGPLPSVDGQGTKPR